MIDKKVFMLCNSITDKEALQLNSTFYQANIKFDGERIIAVKKDGSVALLNRRGHICNPQFPELAEFLIGLECGDFIIDGEVISLNDDFNLLQKRALTKNPLKIKQLIKEVPIKYMVFDILMKGETELRYFPLSKRLEELKILFTHINSPLIEIAKYGDIEEMWEKAKAEDREGIIVKDMSAYYESGRRCDSWRKCKRWLETTLKVVKYEINPSGIRAEDTEGNAVQIAGEQHSEVKEQIDNIGFANVYVQYLEKTGDNKLRFPSYRGIAKEIQ